MVDSNILESAKVFESLNLGILPAVPEPSIIPVKLLPSPYNVSAYIFANLTVLVPKS